MVEKGKRRLGNSSSCSGNSRFSMRPVSAREVKRIHWLRDLGLHENQLDCVRALHVSPSILSYRSWMKWRRGIRFPWLSSTRSCKASERQPSLLLGRLSPSRASSLTQAQRWVSKWVRSPWLERVASVAPLTPLLPFTRLKYRETEPGGDWDLVRIIGSAEKSNPNFLSLLT